jgi:putative addiction module antidote
MSKVSLRKVGSSFVATIPAGTVKALRLKPGQKLEISQESGRLVLTPVSEEFDATMKAHERVLERYRAAFQKLADA